MCGIRRYEGRATGHPGQTRHPRLALLPSWLSRLSRPSRFARQATTTRRLRARRVARRRAGPSRPRRSAALPVAARSASGPYHFHPLPNLQPSHLQPSNPPAHPLPRRSRRRRMRPQTSWCARRRWTRRSVLLVCRSFLRPSLLLLPSRAAKMAAFPVRSVKANYTQSPLPTQAPKEPSNLQPSNLQPSNP